MGRKRWWRGGLELLLLCVLHRATLGDGDIGCLYSKDLCERGYEFCYDDLAFGKCIPLHDDLNEDDIYQYNLDADAMEKLRMQLEDLEFEGYKWPHPYTQCVMQTVMFNIRHNLQSSVDVCDYLKRQDDGRFSQTNDIEDVNIESQPIAIVRFTPSKFNPHGEYADEVYYPPGLKTNFDPYVDDRKKRQRSFSFETQQPIDLYDENVFGYSSKEQTPSARKLYEKALDPELYYSPLQVYDRQESLRTIFPQEYVEPVKVDYDYADTVDELGETDYLPNEMLRIIENHGIPQIDDRDDYDNVDKKQRQEEEMNNDDGNNEDEGEEEQEEEEDYEKTFSRKYKKPKLRSHFSQMDEPVEPKQIFFKTANQKRLSVNQPPKLVNQQLKHEIDKTKQDENDKSVEFLLRSLQSSLPRNQLYTEGGVVQPSQENEDEEDANEDSQRNIKKIKASVQKFLREALSGFKRPERLDVKKPGPLFSTNTYLYKTESPVDQPEKKSNNGYQHEENNDEIIFAPLVEKKTTFNSNKNSKSYNNIDMDHVYVEVKDEFHTWAEGERIVEEISKLLGLERGSLGGTRVGRAEVTFKVMDNNKGYNITEIVNKIDDIRPELQHNLGITIMRAGIGDKKKLPAIIEVRQADEEMSPTVFGAIVATGVVATVAAAIAVLFIVRRHAKSLAKLSGLTTADPEVSKDYQDLCRARMQAKQPNEKPESPRPFRVINRISESNNSPSNRSSTSSWGEEPAPTNMDISTGHMVLSYMEDHLKNQDRLDEEWAAICAYEPDPCATTIAEASENVQYNRPGAVLPYNHSRVVLNDFASVSNSDYINASTITDHDPRNPAYIATQGPLPQTAAHFWQLVWEQGSVVILMLTRLTEEGKAMCHRYWPDEGSELYHIYEVHLVSEHIWCDDYLVRSFYLKNLSTSETRTVTQFHFLSWPENGVPQSTKALLEFRRKVNKSYRGRSCPIVIHCSDGAGRTGTYCLIDMVLNRMAKGAKEIDIAATLEHIRDQRPGMVANKRQFEFVLMAVAEEVHAILKALPVPSADKTTAPASVSAPSTSKLVSFEGSSEKSN